MEKNCSTHLPHIFHTLNLQLEKMEEILSHLGQGNLLNLKEVKVNGNIVWALFVSFIADALPTPEDVPFPPVGISRKNLIETISLLPCVLH